MVRAAQSSQSLTFKMGVVAHKAAIDATFETFDTDRGGTLSYMELDKQIHRRTTDPSAKRAA